AVAAITCRRNHLCHTRLKEDPVVPHPLADAPPCSTRLRVDQLCHTSLKVDPVVPHPVVPHPVVPHPCPHPVEPQPCWICRAA
ncbi:MAG: hypothetical protein ACK559_08475, partial [bacterium]